MCNSKKQCEHTSQRQNKKRQLFSESGTISLDTLAQLGTKPSGTLRTNELDTSNFATNKDFENVLVPQPSIQYLAVQKTNFDDTKTLNTRAQNKYLANNLALSLVDLKKAEKEIALDKAGEKGSSRWTRWRIENIYANKIKKYWNMHHCANVAERVDNKFVTKYCKSRLCTVCNRIRTAELINKYRVVFDAWGDDIYFVTLTARTVPKNRLKQTIDERFKLFIEIQGLLKKRYQRGSLRKFEALRKMECTYNPVTDYYHPHFHLIIRGEENANLAYELWQKKARHLGIDRGAQKVEKANSNSMQELFKYFTKVVTGKDEEKAIYIKSLDHIFECIKGRRTFQPVGFRLKDYVQISRVELEPPTEASREQESSAGEKAPSDSKGFIDERYKWNQGIGDWIGEKTGMLVSGHHISDFSKENCQIVIMPYEYKEKLQVLMLHEIQRRHGY
jgi:hypothetical protein